MILDSTTRKLEILLAGTVAASQLSVTASWVDITPTATTPGNTVSQSSNTSPITIVAAPAASTQRKVAGITIYNADTATATATIRYNDNSTLYTLTKVSVPAGFTLQYSDIDGWSLLSTTGARQSGTTVETAIATALAGINDQTGTSYTIGLGDAGKDVRCTNSSAITLTVPPNSSVPFPVGTWLFFSQGGTGIVTAAAGSGVTLGSLVDTATAGRYDARGLEKTDTNTWRVW